MNIIQRELDSIRPYAANAKKHDATQVANVAESIRQYGFVQPIVIDKDGVIVIGHCRALAAKKLGMTEVPCVCVDDLSAVKTRGGDFAPGELDKALDGTEQAVADAYRQYAEGATLIFAASVRHAQAIAAAIGPDAVVVTGETKNRADIIRDFTERKIKCLVNVMVFTEGTDIPLIETLIIARPTQSDSLYTQMVGRGLPLHVRQCPPRARDNQGQRQPHGV